MNKRIVLAMLLLPLLFTACNKEDRILSSTAVSKSTKQIKNENDNSSGHIKITVLSDIHYMDASLFSNNAGAGLPFQHYLFANPNKALQEYSVPIFNKVIEELKYENPDLILIAGDLTKDGEKVSHDQMNSLLHQLQNDNRKVFLVPGNNDINNPTAFRYSGNDSFPVPNISPDYFSTAYADFGYSGTIRDPNSLSYLAKPYPDLWILGIDAVKYTPTVSRSGKIKPETMQWIKQQLDNAKKDNAMVFGLMHHNLIEHFQGQSTGAFRGTVIDNWEATADSLMNWGLKIIFTGHNHSTDISSYDWNGHTLYDIETGSLVTTPSAYRLLVLKNKELDISTNHIKTIDAQLPDNVDFTTFSNNKLTQLLDGWFPTPLSSMFGVPAEFIPQAVPVARNAYAAHMAGEEKLLPEEQMKINQLSAQLGPNNQGLINLVASLWTDTGIKDWQWHIKLTNP
jgi:3',5'-cyclic AMP phosphodiesterase CpdA